MHSIEMKTHSFHWKRPEVARQQKAHQVQSNVKVLLTVLFDCNGVVHREILSQGQTVSNQYYLEVMRQLRKAIRQKYTEL